MPKPVTNVEYRSMALEAPAIIKPGPLRDNAASRTMNALHLVLLMICIRIQFPKLVADPVGVLTETLIILVSIQVVWTLLCCRPAGWREDGKEPPHPLVPAILAMALTACTAPMFYILFVLFGAPFLTHIYHTLLCAATLAVLSAFPVFYVHGVNFKAWSEILGASASCDEISCGFWGGIIGAWLGAVPIPLDWDREWQKWPVTIVCGIFGGYALGCVVGNIMVQNSREHAVAPAAELTKEARKAIPRATPKGKPASRKMSKKA